MKFYNEDSELHVEVHMFDYELDSDMFQHDISQIKSTLPSLVRSEDCELDEIRPMACD